MYENELWYKFVQPELQLYENRTTDMLSVVGHACTHIYLNIGIYLSHFRVLDSDTKVETLNTVQLYRKPAQRVPLILSRLPRACVRSWLPGMV